MSTLTERPRTRQPIEQDPKPTTTRVGGWFTVVWPYLLVIPAVVFLTALLVWPLIQGFWMSFTNTRLINPLGGQFVGIANYEALLGQGGFWKSVTNTLGYTLVTVVGAVSLGTASALLLHGRKFRGSTAARGLLMLPWAMPTVATSIIFLWMFNFSGGVFNRGLQAVGLPPVGWLTDPNWAMISVTTASVWAVFPLVMLVVLAALQSVSKELYEAAAIDGASAFQSFRAITLPHIAPTLRVVTLLMTIWSIRRFEIIYLLTGGGPNEATTTLVVDIYLEAFQNQQLGRAAAIGALGLVLSLLVTLAYALVEVRIGRKEARSS